MITEILISFAIVEIVGFWFGYQVYTTGRKRLARDIVRALIALPFIYITLVLMIGMVPLNR